MIQVGSEQNVASEKKGGLELCDTITICQFTTVMYTLAFLHLSSQTKWFWDLLGLLIMKTGQRIHSVNTPPFACLPSLSWTCNRLGLMKNLVPTVKSRKKKKISYSWTITIAGIKSHHHVQRKSHFIIFHKIALKSCSIPPSSWTSNKFSLGYSQGSLSTKIGPRVEKFPWYESIHEFLHLLVPSAHGQHSTMLESTDPRARLQVWVSALPAPS